MDMDCFSLRFRLGSRWERTKTVLADKVLFLLDYGEWRIYPVAVMLEPLSVLGHSVLLLLRSSVITC